jgi:hypothetical protein
MPRHRRRHEAGADEIHLDALGAQALALGQFIGKQRGFARAIGRSIRQRRQRGDRTDKYDASATAGAHAWDQRHGRRQRAGEICLKQREGLVLVSISPVGDVPTDTPALAMTQSTGRSASNCKRLARGSSRRRTSATSAWTDAPREVQASAVWASRAASRPTNPSTTSDPASLIASARPMPLETPLMT